MFSRSFNRVVWKEFRTQQSFFLALLATAILLQFIHVVLPPAMQQSMRLYPFLIGSVLSVCYAVACGVLLFAKEREDETDRLLQTIAVAPRDLMAGKLTFAVVSVALLTGLLYLSALGVSSIVYGAKQALPVRDETEVYAVYMYAIPLALSAAIFCSLLVKRVISGLLSAVALLLVITGTTGLFHTTIWKSNQWVVSDQVCAVLLLLGSIPLMSAWVSGGANWSMPRFFISKKERHSSRFRLNTALRWSANRASPAGRALGVIVWKEWQTAGWVLLAGLILTSGWIPVLVLNPRETSPSNFLALMTVWFGVSAIGSCFLLSLLGLLVSSGDQRQRSMRFYVDRGAHPTLIWLGKQAIWLTVLIILAIPVTYTMIQAGILAGPVRMTWMGEWTASTPRQVAIIISFLFSSYSAVQLLGLWCRNPIVAAALSFSVCLWLVAVHAVLFAFRIPLWLSTGPLILGAMAASLLSMDDWLKERWSWKHFFKRSAWVAVPTVISFAGMFVWRIVEVPLVDPGFDWRTHERDMAQFDPEWTYQWRALVRDSKLPLDKRAAREPSFAEQFRTLAQKAAQQPNLRIDPEFLATEPSLVNLLHEFGRERLIEVIGTDKSSLDEQWEDLWAALQISASLSATSLTTTDAESFIIANYSLHIWARAWAQDPRQTPESLQRLIDAPVLLPFVSTQNNYVTLRQAYCGTGWGRQTWQGDYIHETLGQFPFSLLVEERSRLIRILNQRTRLEGSQSIETLLRNRVARENPELTEWESTTPQISSDYYSASRLDSLFVRCYEAAWMTRVVARLEKYRLEEGAYPEQLEAVLRNMPQIWNSVHPYDYQYRPDGLPDHLVMSSSWIIPAGEPVLFRATEVAANGRDLARSLKHNFPERDEQMISAIELLESGKILFGKTFWTRMLSGAYDRTELVQALNNIPEKTGRIQAPHWGMDKPTP